MQALKPVNNPLGQGTLSMGTKTKMPGRVNSTAKNTTPTPAPASQQVATGTRQNNTSLDPLKKTALGIQSKLNELAAQKQAPQQQASQAPTFPGAVGSLMQAAQAGSPVAGTAAGQLVNTPAGTPTAQKYTQQTADYGAGNLGIGQAAADILKNFGQQYADVGQKGAAFAAGQRSTGTTPVAEGNAAVTAQTTAAQQQALAQGAQTALQGTGQELTAQQQAANAANAAAGTALTGQSNQIAAQNEAGQLGIAGQGQLQSGLTSAGTLAQPSGNYPFTFNPLTGSFSQAAGGTQVTASQAAQAVKSGQMTPDQALSSLSYLGPTAQSQLYSAMRLIDPTFNWNQATVNANTAGSLAPQGNLASQELQNLQSVIAQVPAWQATSIPAINFLGNLVAGVTGVGLKDRQELTNAINAVRGSVTTALGTAYNTTPTAFTGMVNEWFPDNPTPDQVQAGIKQFNTLMAARASSFQSPGTTQLPATAGGGDLWSW